MRLKLKNKGFLDKTYSTLNCLSNGMKYMKIIEFYNSSQFFSKYKHPPMKTLKILKIIKHTL